jgi:hypothetical protein
MPVFLALVLGGCAQVETVPLAAVSSAGPSVPASNSAPIISGQPLAAIAPGSSYVFRPTASDNDGDTLAFSIQNKPSWMTFNVASGVLTGVPATSDLGIFPNIVISVSDGVAITALPPFVITVDTAAPLPPSAPIPLPGPPVTGTGTATLSWTVPTQHTDGSSLNDLAGFRVYYGTSTGALLPRYVLTNPMATQFSVTGLPSGTWYFAVSAYSAGGVESDLSNVGSKLIP